MTEGFTPVQDLTREEGTRVASDTQGMMRDEVLKMTALDAMKTAHDNVRARRIVAGSKETAAE